MYHIYIYIYIHIQNLKKNQKTKQKIKQLTSVSVLSFRAGAESCFCRPAGTPLGGIAFLPPGVIVGAVLERPSVQLLLQRPSCLKDLGEGVVSSGVRPGVTGDW